MKNKKKVIGNTVFFFALFGLTAYAVLKGKELSELAEVLKSVKPAYYIAGLVMIVVFVCCESYIIYRMLRLLHYNDVPKRNCVKYSFVGFFFSCITPSATGGQPMQLYYMNRDKVDISVGTVILMIVTILYKFCSGIFRSTDLFIPSFSCGRIYWEGSILLLPWNGIECVLCCVHADSCI